MSYLKKAFGTNVKLIRKSRNLTQEQLAELLEIMALERKLARERLRGLLTGLDLK